MADNGELREDLKIPDGELGTQLRVDYEAGKELLVSNILMILKYLHMQIILLCCYFYIYLIVHLDCSLVYNVIT